MMKLREIQTGGASCRRGPLGNCTTVVEWWKLARGWESSRVECGKRKKGLSEFSILSSHFSS